MHKIVLYRNLISVEDFSKSPLSGTNFRNNLVFEGIEKIEEREPQKRYAELTCGPELTVYFDPITGVKIEHRQLELDSNKRYHKWPEASGGHEITVRLKKPDLTIKEAIDCGERIINLLGDNAPQANSVRAEYARVRLRGS